MQEDPWAAAIVARAASTPACRFAGSRAAGTTGSKFWHGADTLGFYSAASAGFAGAGQGQPRRVGQDHRLHTILKPSFIRYARHMGLDRPFPDEEPLSDLGIDRPSAIKRKTSRSRAVSTARGSCPARGQDPSEPRHQLRRGLTSQGELPGGNGPHSCHDGLGVIGLDQESTGTRVDGASKNSTPRARMWSARRLLQDGQHPAGTSRGGDPVHLGHAHVHQDHVRCADLSLGHGFATIARLAHPRRSRAPPPARSAIPPGQILIIDDQNSYRTWNSTLSDQPPADVDPPACVHRIVKRAPGCRQRPSWVPPTNLD